MPQFIQVECYPTCGLYPDFRSKNIKKLIIYTKAWGVYKQKCSKMWYGVSVNKVLCIHLCILLFFSKIIFWCKVYAKQKVLVLFVVQQENSVWARMPFSNPNPASQSSRPNKATWQQALLLPFFWFLNVLSSNSCSWDSLCLSFLSCFWLCPYQ